MSSTPRFQQILGVRFFVGDAQGAIDEVSQHGGLVVVPAAPALKNLAVDKGYREALLGGGFCHCRQRFHGAAVEFDRSQSHSKLSGLKYLRALIEEPDFRSLGNTFWVMPTAGSAQRNLRWLRQSGVNVANEDVYLAPSMGRDLGRRVAGAHRRAAPQAHSFWSGRRNSGAARFVSQAAA
jgi:N-acetylglucosaminyldiphosphoundecaprenol N-acetyl-beta-D-mannosaminyltransferase